MSLSLSIQWNFAKIPLVKIEQNNKNPIFQNKNAFFFIFGGVVTRSAFYKMFTILREDFFFTPHSSCDTSARPLKVYFLCSNCRFLCSNCRFLPSLYVILVYTLFTILKSRRELRISRLQKPVF